jgi:biopolymer transport protein ExbB/TolQ
MQETNRELVERIMALPILQAEWVLWFLFALSVLSLAIIVERTLFMAMRRADTDAVRARLHDMLAVNARDEALGMLRKSDSMETNVLAAAERGPEAVEELVKAQLSAERQRYERALPLLAVVGSNAPFIGLFGTVLGIIRAFRDLAGASSGTGQAVMSGVSEALVATAVGLLVAIPAVAAFNMLKARIKKSSERADQLVRTLLAELKSEPTSHAHPAE